MFLSFLSTPQKNLKTHSERMNDILEGFEEILDDLKEFPDKGKINALTKMVRNLLEDELWSNSRLFFILTLRRATTTTIDVH